MLRSNIIDLLEVDSAGDGDGRSVLGQHVDMRGAVVRVKVKRRVVIRDIVGG